MKKALFAGTFDPPSLGHADIIQRAAQLYETLYVGIATNSTKKFIFSALEREKMLHAITKGLPNVKVVIFEGLVVDFAKEKKVDCLVRGLRGCADLEFEFQMAFSNKKMTGIETQFLMADERYAHISSTIIREIATNGRRLHGFVPDAIENEVFNFLAS